MLREGYVWWEYPARNEPKTALECPLIGNGDSVIIKWSGIDFLYKQGGTTGNLVPWLYFVYSQGTFFRETENSIKFFHKKEENDHESY